jgi:hypothetical protein
MAFNSAVGALIWNEALVALVSGWKGFNKEALMAALAFMRFSLSYGKRVAPCITYYSRSVLFKVCPAIQNKQFDQ